MNNFTIEHKDSGFRMEMNYPTVKTAGFMRLSLAKANDGVCEWDGAISVDLGILDLALVHQVLNGECESANDGNPLVIGGVCFLMKHVCEPENCYAMGMKRGDERMQIMLKPHEALAMSRALDMAYFFLSFVRGVG